MSDSQIIAKSTGDSYCKRCRHSIDVGEPVFADSNDIHICIRCTAIKRSAPEDFGYKKMIGSSNLENVLRWWLVVFTPWLIGACILIAMSALDVAALSNGRDPYYFICQLLILALPAFGTVILTGMLAPSSKQWAAVASTLVIVPGTWLLVNACATSVAGHANDLVIVTFLACSLAVWCFRNSDQEASIQSRVVGALSETDLLARESLLKSVIRLCDQRKRDFFVANLQLIEVLRLRGRDMEAESVGQTVIRAAAVLKDTGLKTLMERIACRELARVCEDSSRFEEAEVYYNRALDSVAGTVSMRESLTREYECFKRRQNVLGDQKADNRLIAGDASRTALPTTPAEDSNQLLTFSRSAEKDDVISSNQS